jgi:general secretion pathway protein E
MLQRPTGIVLVTGPTGSGKTTSLYGMMAHIDGRFRNILTVEDPIEYELPGVGQTQVNAQIGMTFARSLRAILRQDPDVILVGEIRDAETAQIAVQASLTGHLVFSTLHTNSAVGAVTRLRDMGVESFLLASTLAGLIAQRLVRVTCPQCRAATPTPAASRQPFIDVGLEPPEELWHGRGCPHCAGTGFRGRTGIYEVVTVDDEIRDLIYQDRSEREIELRALGHADSLRKSALRLAADGTTSLEEAVRVTRGD